MIGVTGESLTDCLFWLVCSCACGDPIAWQKTIGLRIHIGA